MFLGHFCQAAEKAENLKDLRDAAAFINVKQVPQLSTLLRWISRKESIDLEELSATMTRSVCGKHVENEPAFKCQTCSNDESSVICIDCFDASKHVGHKFDYITAIGMCDCGYYCTIDPRGFCDKHTGNNVIRDFTEEELYFDDLKTKKAVFMLVSIIHSALTTRNYELYDSACDLLNSLIFLHPLDYLRNVFTKCLIIDPSLGFEEFETFKDIRRHILPYRNFMDICNLELSLSLEFPSLYIISHAEYYFPADVHGQDQLTTLLGQEQISEPLFRFLLIFFYYMRSTFLVQQLTCDITGVSEAIMDAYAGRKLFIVPARWNHNIVMQKQIWSDIPVELYTDHLIDADHACLATAIEFCTHWVALARICGATQEQGIGNLEYHNELQTTLNEDLQRVSKQLYSGERVQNLVRSTIDACERYIPEFCAYNPVEEYNQGKFNFISDYHFNAIFLCYSEKIPQYFQQLLAQRLPYFCYLLLFEPMAFLCVPRFRDRSVLQSNNLLQETLRIETNMMSLAYNYSLGMYAGFLYNQAEDIYALDHPIVRANDRLVCCGACPVRAFHIEYVVYFLTLAARHPRHYFAFNQKAKYRHIPDGYAYHTQDPICESDSIFAEGRESETVPEPENVAQNIYITTLSFALEAHYEYHENPEATAEFLCEVLKRQPAVWQQQSGDSQTAHALKAAPVLAAWAIRQSVTSGLSEANCFKSLTATEDYVKFALFEFANKHEYNYHYNCLVVMQNCFLASLYDPEFTSTHFIHEFLEHYGVINPVTGEFLPPHRVEAAEKMLSLRQHALRTLLQIVMRLEFCSSHSDFKMKYILAFLIFNEGECTYSQLTKQFYSFVFYNGEIFSDLLKSITDRDENSAKYSNVYDTTRCTAVNRLNKRGLEMIDLFDGFLANIPMLLAERDRAAAFLKCSPVPDSTFARPFNEDAAVAVFNNPQFLQLLAELILQTFINNKNYLIKSNISEIYILVALKWAIHYNPLDERFPELLNRIPRDEKRYSPPVWLVLTEISRKEIPTQEIALEERLKQLHTKLNLKEVKELRQLNETHEIELSSETIRTLNYLMDINEYETDCSVCMLANVEQQLFMACTPASVEYNGEILVTTETCMHLVHKHCIQFIDDEYYECPICRMLQPVLIPLFYSASVKLNFEAVEQLFGVLIEYFDFGEAGNCIGAVLKDGSAFSSELLPHIKSVLEAMFTQELRFAELMNSEQRSSTMYQQKMCRQSLILCYAYYQAWRVCCDRFSVWNFRLCDNGGLYADIETKFAEIHVQNELLDKQKYEQHVDAIQNSGKYRYLNTTISFKEFSFMVKVSQTFKAVFNCADFIGINGQEIHRIQMAKMPDYYSDFIRDVHQCDKCKERGRFMCMFCGSFFCPRHVDKMLTHDKECSVNHHQLCFYIFDRNIMVYRLFNDVFYYSGGPYLSDEGEDDCERNKRIPLYFNQILYDNLSLMLEYANTQLSLGYVLQSSRITSLCHVWFLRECSE